MNQTKAKELYKSECYVKEYCETIECPLSQITHKCCSRCPYIEYNQDNKGWKCSKHNLLRIGNILDANRLFSACGVYCDDFKDIEILSEQYKNKLRQIYEDREKQKEAIRLERLEEKRKLPEDPIEKELAKKRFERIYEIIDYSHFSNNSVKIMERTFEGYWKKNLSASAPDIIRYISNDSIRSDEIFNPIIQLIRFIGFADFNESIKELYEYMQPAFI